MVHTPESMKGLSARRCGCCSSASGESKSFAARFSALDRLDRGEGIEIEDEDGLRLFFEDIKERGRKRLEAEQARPYRLKQSAGPDRDQLAGQTVVGHLLARREGDLLVGRQVAFGLVIGDVPVEAQQEIVLPPQRPQAVEVVGQRPVVQVVGEPRHAAELPAGREPRVDDPVGQVRRQQAAGEQLRPVAVVGVGGRRREAR